MLRQYGVLVFDLDREGALRFLLITSRTTKRWVIPRGNPIPGLSPARSAAEEAYEEAGLTGLVSAEPIGAFEYGKVRKDGSVEPAIVQVFSLRATVQSARFPERLERETRWFTRAEAAEAVDEQGLKDLILGFDPPATAGRTPMALLSASPQPRSGLGILKLFRKMMPKEDSFFDMFARHAETVVGGADAMVAMIAGQAGIEESCAKITEFEHEADSATRDVLLAVRRSFITPFDRSAITSLISSMDDSIDEMRQTTKAITLYDVTSFEPQMGDMAALAGQAARLVTEAIPLLRSVGRNADRLHRITENIVHLESAADDLHEQGLKALFTEHGRERPMDYFVGREIYSHLERVLDSFEDVANEIQGIVIDHA